MMHSVWAPFVSALMVQYYCIGTSMMHSVWAPFVSALTYGSVYCIYIYIYTNMMHSVWAPFVSAQTEGSVYCISSLPCCCVGMSEWRTRWSCYWGEELTPMHQGCLCPSCSSPSRQLTWIWFEPCWWKGRLPLQGCPRMWVCGGVGVDGWGLHACGCRCCRCMIYVTWGCGGVCTVICVCVWVHVCLWVLFVCLWCVCVGACVCVSVCVWLSMYAEQKVDWHCYTYLQPYLCYSPV